jgi:hypothetical protein
MGDSNIANLHRSRAMNISLDYFQGESLALASVFSDRLAIIDLPPEIWDDEGEQKPVNVRGEEELLKRLDERLKHAVTLARPAPPWREASHESWDMAYTTRVPSYLYVAWFPDREEQRTLYWALMDRGIGLRSCRSGDFYYVEVDFGRLGAALVHVANPVEGYR